MPGGDLATRFPERMLYGILPDNEVLSLLASRGWPDMDLGVLKKQLSSGINVPLTTSTGRVLDAASALLGICQERTYDGEPAMKLESAAAGMMADRWELTFSTLNGCEVLSSRALMRTVFEKLREEGGGDRAGLGRSPASIAAMLLVALGAGLAAAFAVTLIVDVPFVLIIFLLEATSGRALGRRVEYTSSIDHSSKKKKR